MEKIVRIGNVTDQDAIRRDDINKMSPAARVSLVFQMQRKYLQWDKNSTIKRVASIRKMKFE
jgi:hypothetical protein